MPNWRLWLGAVLHCADESCSPGSGSGSRLLSTTASGPAALWWRGSSKGKAAARSTTVSKKCHRSFTSAPSFVPSWAPSKSKLCSYTEAYIPTMAHTSIPPIPPSSHDNPFILRSPVSDRGQRIQTSLCTMPTSWSSSTFRSSELCSSHAFKA